MEHTTVFSGIIREFSKLSAIPRPSGHEEAVSAYLMDRLTGLGLRPERDVYYNVICDVPATPGWERKGRLVLQAHSDMVCVGAADYRPLEDPVTIPMKDGWLCTDGRSSLGADCGIGLAAAMFLVASDFPHGPLRLIFTADEERGLAGAQNIRRDCLRGCDGLINLDGFHFGNLLISSAGGLRQTFYKKSRRISSTMQQGIRLRLSGLRGGHSGDDIGLGRANGARLMIWLLQTLPFSYELASFSSGTAHNAIPTQAQAVIAMDPMDETVLRGTTAAFLRDALEIYGRADPELALTVEPVEQPQTVLPTEDRDDLLALAGLIQCGSWAQHPLCPDCVGSSGSLGLVAADETKLEIYSFLRSYDDAVLQERGAQYALAAEGLGFSVWEQGYGAWPGVAQDPLTELFQTQGRQLGLELNKTTAHVGLEASVFHQMAPEMPIVSVGMEVLDPHSVHERVKLDTIEPFGRLLAAVIREYGK